MIRLILARHGNTFETGQTPIQVGARTDLPLTQQGRGQAEQIANFLHRQKIKPAAIFAGALKRQTESAEIIGKQLGIPIELNQTALTEIDYGPWEGLTSEEIVKRWPHEYARWTEEGRWAEKIFGGSKENHLQKIDLWLDSLRKKYRAGETVVAITSNGTIRFFLQNTDFQKPAGELKVKTGHFCELELARDRLIVKSWNQNPTH